MPRRPLARIYRPQRFAEVLGQEAPVRALSAAAARGDVASAYIFSGTRGIGKTTIARVFAKALNCDKGPAADCCDACTPCREIAEARALDVLELDAATHTGIDDVRELREAAQYPPTRDRYRIFILDEAHQLSNAAWNGLLKILEEPPPYCVFLFCTTEPHKIPATIESRALHFAFRSPAPAAIRGHLAEVAKKEKVAVEDEALDLLARAADGSVRDGLSALDQVRALADGREDRKITAAAVRDALGLIPGEVVTGYLAALAGGDAAAALAVVAELDREGQDLRSFAGELLDRVRHAAVARATGRDADAAELAELAIEQLAWLGKVLDETEMRLRQNAPQRVLMDLATVRMTRMASLPALASVVEALGRGGPAGGPGPGGGPAGRGAGGATPRPAISRGASAPPAAPVPAGAGRRGPGNRPPRRPRRRPRAGPARRARRQPARPARRRARDDQPGARQLPWRARRRAARRAGHAGSRAAPREADLEGPLRAARSARGAAGGGPPRARQRAGRRRGPRRRPRRDRPRRRSCRGDDAFDPRPGAGRRAARPGREGDLRALRRRAARRPAAGRRRRHPGLTRSTTGGIPP